MALKDLGTGCHLLKLNPLHMDFRVHIAILKWLYHCRQSELQQITMYL